MSEISIVILTHNSVRFIGACLCSIFTQNYQNFEAIIVDNGSSDGTVEFVKENYPRVVFVDNKENLGACKARNQGIEISKGKWILTLDCDIVLEKDFLNKMIRFAGNAEDSIGIFQPKILKVNRKTIYSCGIVFSNLIRFNDIGKGMADNARLDKVKYVFGACSAAALYKRKMLEEIKEETGYFDERFFFMVEDVDLAWRAQKRGWKALFLPDVVCYHYGNSSSSDKSIRQFLCWRNRRFLTKKCQLSLFNLTIIYLFYDLPRLAFLFIINSCVRNEILSSIRSNKYRTREVNRS